MDLSCEWWTLAALVFVVGDFFGMMIWRCETWAVARSLDDDADGWCVSYGVMGDDDVGWWRLVVGCYGLCPLALETSSI